MKTATMNTLVFMLAVASVFRSCGHGKLPEPVRIRSHYVHHSQERDNDTVVVFVHGILGDATKTWTNPESGVYWPDLMGTDHLFDKVDVFVYSYSTPLLSSAYSVSDLADNLKLILDDQHVVDDHKNVVFLCHSMGGLVVRRMLLRYRDDVAPKVKMVYFFSTPTSGSDLAALGAVLSKNPQYGAMLPVDVNAEAWSQQQDWRAAAFHFASHCGYETADLYGFRIVQAQSAAMLCNGVLDPIRGNHEDVVKPEDIGDDPHLAFRRAFKQDVKPLPVAHLQFSTSPVGTEAKAQSLVVKLVDVEGDPVRAKEPVSFKLSASNAQLASPELTINEGDSGASVRLFAKEPTVSEVVLSQDAAIPWFPERRTQVAFMPGKEYVPKGQLAVRLSINPGFRLRLGESGEIVAALQDGNGVPILAPRDYHISFASKDDGIRVVPHEIVLRRGQAFGTASVSGYRPGSYTLTTLITPVIGSGNSVTTIEITERAAGLRMVAKYNFTQSVLPRRVPLKVGLIDMEGNWIQSTLDRRVIVTLEQPSAGSLDASELTIPKGTAVAMVGFTPSREGAFEIDAASPGLQPARVTVTFVYARAFFILLAFVGGFLGAMGRFLVGRRSFRRPAAVLFLFSGVGAAVAIQLAVSDFGVQGWDKILLTAALAIIAGLGAEEVLKLFAAGMELVRFWWAK